jgi:hypothetical protein
MTIRRGLCYNVVMKRYLTALTIVFFTVWFSACSPTQVSDYYAQRGYQIDQATAEWVSAEIRKAPPRHPIGMSEADLKRLRNCESHSNYRAVSKSGKYRGAYQFSQATWDAVARRVDRRFLGMDPATAPPLVQDRFTEWNYHISGWSQWPHCGRFLR